MTEPPIEQAIDIKFEKKREETAKEIEPETKEAPSEAGTTVVETTSPIEVPKVEPEEQPPVQVHKQEQEQEQPLAPTQEPAPAPALAAVIEVEEKKDEESEMEKVRELEYKKNLEDQKQRNRLQNQLIREKEQQEQQQQQQQLLDNNGKLPLHVKSEYIWEKFEVTVTKRSIKKRDAYTKESSWKTTYSTFVSFYLFFLAIIL
ncbi:hypothetical protein RFI_11258 [Reticulomyxa filosa]|uniref:Uncharacterized protein n=1 Tax=Reticulomyxa filosa TaxID=46433 RepID=X6NJK2_RETFI|nr:hypothetical protein RFI_11258 [Reticulomyxa filosa]|eukprot:ETO25879.1 hypothetical protein RFI_11258 [Reticulomyxa filosa]